MTLSPHEPGPGDTIGPYRVLRRLGAGGMGVVLEAWDPALQRAVAVKVVAPAFAADEGFRQRFAREARAQASLTSVHVVPVLAHGEERGLPWLAMPLYPDGDLARLLAGGSGLPRRLALPVVADVAQGLADAHAAGLVHRDVKPGNVLLRRRPEGLVACLGDFGLVTPVGSRDAATGTAGTPAFLAPEVRAGAPASPAADVYALGCLLWTTLTGRQAMWDGSVPELVGADDQTRALNDLLAWCSQPDPRARPVDAAGVLDALRAAMRLPDVPPPLRPPVPVPRRSRLVPVAAAVAVGATALAVTLGAVFPGGVGPLRQVADRGDALEGRAGAAVRVSTVGAAGPPDTWTARAASAAMAEAFAREPGVSTGEAICIARAWVADVGLAQMVSAGLLDARLGYVDQPPASLPGSLRRAGEIAVDGCITT